MVVCVQILTFGYADPQHPMHLLRRNSAHIWEGRQAAIILSKQAGILRRKIHRSHAGEASICNQVGKHAQLAPVNGGSICVLWAEQAMRHGHKHTWL